jgi:hypothetical protein
VVFPLLDRPTTETMGIIGYSQSQGPGI